ncbi:MAG: hypothetical protein HY675_07505 [Chloroflexi bacterium]|nr:hypothetical protein [Chloroflexota bacterium]
MSTEVNQFPEAPPGFDIEASIQYAEAARNARQERETETTFGQFLGEIGRMQEGDIGQFYELAKTGGEWDIKAHYGREYEDYGNFHCGVVAVAWGIPEDVALRGAGAYQTYSDMKASLDTLGENVSRAFAGEQMGSLPGPTGSGIPGITAPYGDQAKDHFFIQLGYDYYRSRSGK